MSTANLVEDTMPLVKLNRRRILELGLYSSVLTTLTMVMWWFWQGWIAPVSLVNTASYSPVARLTQLLLAREIVLGLALAEFLLGLAVLMGLTPIGWWLESDLMPQPVASPVMRLANSIRKVQAAQKANAAPMPGVALLPDGSPDPAAQPQPIGPESPIPGQSVAPGVPGTATGPSAQHQVAGQPGQPQVAGQPGQPQPGQPQAAQPGQPQVAAQPGQPQPGQPQAAAQPGQPGQPGQLQAAAQPGQPQPAGQMPHLPPSPSALLAEDIPMEEENPLDMLGDMSDLLSVFEENEGIPEWITNMSSGLDDLEIEYLTAFSTQLLNEFRAPRTRTIRSSAASFTSNAF